MAIDDKKKPKIIADVKFGKLNKTQIAQKWRISRNSLNKIIAEFRATPGENEQELSKIIERSATDRIVKTESSKLTNFTAEHIDNIDLINKSAKVLQEAFVEELKDAEGKLNKADGDKYKSLNQALEIAAKTFDLTFKSKRLAMGLDKDQSEKQMQVNLINYADADDSI